MKKFYSFCFVLSIVSLAGALSLWAGGKSDSQTASKDGVTVISVWVNDAHNKDQYLKAVDAFNGGIGMGKGIRIEYTVYGGDFQNALDIAISADEEPEIYKDNNKLTQHILMNKLVPLTELPNFKDVLDEYAPYQKEGMTSYKGVPYSLPMMQNTTGLIYNKELLNRIKMNDAPKTWEEFERACIAISKLEPGKIFGMGYPLKRPDYPVSYVLGSLAPSYGTYQFDFTTGKYVFSKFVLFFEMLQRIRAAGAMFPGMESLDDDTFRAQFAAGNIGFILGSSSSNVGVLYDQFSAKMEWGVAPIPVRDPGNSYNHMSASGTLYAVSQKAKTKGVLPQVSEVLRMFASKELRQDLFTAGKDLPIISKYAAEAVQSNRPQWNSFAKNSVNSVLRPFFPDTAFAIEGDDVYTVFTRIILGDLRPAAGLADLDTRYNAALEKAVGNGTIKLDTYLDPTIATKFKYGH